MGVIAAITDKDSELQLVKCLNELNENLQQAVRIMREEREDRSSIRRQEEGLDEVRQLTRAINGATAAVREAGPGLRRR